MMAITFWLILAACGVSSFLLLLGLYEAWRVYWSPRQKLLDERVHQLFRDEQSKVHTEILQRRSLSRIGALDRYLAQVPGMAVFERLLLRADWPLNVSQSILLCSLLMTVSGVAGLVLQFPVPVTGFLMLATLGGAVYYLRYRGVKRIVAIENQLPDALDLMVRALQSGHAFISALQIAASESRAPIAPELRKVFDEINLGMGVQSAMEHLASRIASKEIRYFVVAVLIQNETGGNLADVLRKTATLIRERQKIAGVVRVLSAEGRISAWILSVMPFLLAFLLYIINPEFISALWSDPMGLAMLTISLSLMLVGIFWMSRLVQIKV
jgi:tight adherence protein B